MSQRKTERLLNLTIALLCAPRFLTREQLRSAIEGYDQTNEATFQRQFERDKDELRSLGVPVATGHNDPWFDDEIGYRILRSDFELPPIEFTPDEAAAIGIAARAWQDSVASAPTSNALRKLRASGIDPDPARAVGLEARVPASAPAFEPLWEALTSRRRVRFTYKEQAREVDPYQLTSRNGSWYLIGFDHTRDAVRSYKLDRITTGPELVGGAGAFTPDPVAVAEHRAGLVPASSTRTARIAIAEGQAPELRRTATPIDGDTLPGYRLFELPYGRDDALVADLCAAAPHALLVAPLELRSQVIERLVAMTEADA